MSTHNLRFRAKIRNTKYKSVYVGVGLWGSTLHGHVSMMKQRYSNPRTMALEPPHKKTYFFHLRTTNTQISLCACEERLVLLFYTVYVV